jgi:hypothetical protein
MRSPESCRNASQRPFSHSKALRPESCVGMRWYYLKNMLAYAPSLRRSQVDCSFEMQTDLLVLPPA